MLVISTSVALAIAASPDIDPDAPLIGWHNVVTAAGVSATSEQASYPAVNLANPATHPQAQWRATSTADQYITIATGEIDEIDYIAVARHNWRSAGLTVSVDGLIGGVWTQIVDDIMLPDDSPALFRFEAQPLSHIRFYLRGGSAPARAAVIHVGRLLVLERKVWVGHVPLPHGFKRQVSNGRSESGEFLGRIVLGEWRESVLPLSLLTPDWFRENMQPFLTVAGERTFFLAWRPDAYPREVGYCWTVDDPAPTPQAPSNLIAFDLKISGIS